MQSGSRLKSVSSGCAYEHYCGTVDRITDKDTVISGEGRHGYKVDLWQ